MSKLSSIKRAESPSNLRRSRHWSDGYYRAAQSPPTTLASAPSIPATTIMTLACWIWDVRKQSVQARDAYIANQLCPLAHNLRGNFGLEATGKSAVPAVTIGRTDFDGVSCFCSRTIALAAFSYRARGNCPVFAMASKTSSPALVAKTLLPFAANAAKFFDYLFDCFAWAVNHLRKALTDMAMVVNAGKTKVFIRQMAKLLDRLVNRYIACFDLLHNFLECSG